MKKINTLRSKENSVKHKKAVKRSQTEFPKNEKSDITHDWKSYLSQRFISEYALPLTRKVEAKLIKLQQQSKL